MKIQSSFALVALLILSSDLCPNTLAIVPAPDGGYPGGNTAEGQNALLSLTTGTYNTAVGLFSLRSNTEGNFNTAVGAGTLLANVGDPDASDGIENTAIGAGALLSNRTGLRNTAIGAFALFNNVGGDFGDGSNNTAIGASALLNNTTGGGDVAIGHDALHENTEGIDNVANGNVALYSNISGYQNTAVGLFALAFNVAGNNNTALGLQAGYSITGSGNVCIGQGVEGEADVDDTTYIRNVNTLVQSFSAGVNDYVTVRLSDGRLGHTAIVSSQRYKEDIKPLAPASNALYALKPVSFRLKKEFDPKQALGFGLVAEEVEKVNSDLVYRNDKGQVESVRYEMINAMLLSEFLKQHEAFVQEQEKVREQDRKIREQEITIVQLKKEVETVLVRLNQHDSEIQTVTDQVKVNGTAAQFSSGNQ
ncbi:MAG: hypothetical protein DME65_02570 [Verrucomicrobia bacterium]|nr:MAG: hypothetical protein DME65_02570 [Verrucomicrobiota bacterium]